MRTSSLRTLPKPVLPALLAVLLVLVATYVVLGVTAEAAPPDQEPRLADSAGSGADYRSGSLPGDHAQAVAVAVEAVPLALGYDYRSLEEGLDKATALMTSDFAEEFRRTFEASAAELAETQQAVTSATVRAAGVVRTEDGRVLTLVYVDQALVSSTTMQDADAPVRVSQNRVLVGLAQEDGKWRVDSIAPF